MIAYVITSFRLFIYIIKPNKCSFSIKQYVPKPPDWFTTVLRACFSLYASRIYLPLIDSSTFTYRIRHSYPHSYPHSSPHAHLTITSPVFIYILNRIFSTDGMKFERHELVIYSYDNHVNESNL
jgi:hypothetical protein